MSLALVGSSSATYTESGLPSGLTIGPSSGIISGTVVDGDDADSPYVVTVTATSGSHSASQTFLLQVPTVGIATPAAQTSTEDQSVTLDLSTSRSSGRTFAATGLPDGLSINSSSGVISGTLAVGSTGNYTVDVSVSYGDNASVTSFSWTVDPVVSFAAIADQTNTVGDGVSLYVPATDSLNESLTYSDDGLPPGLSINSSGDITGAISTTSGTQGMYGVTVIATDGTNTGSYQFNWRVHEMSIAGPTLTNPGTQFNRPWDSIDFFPTASDSDGSPLTYTVDGLPPGLELEDPSTGEIEGTLDNSYYPDSPYLVTITVTDDTNHTASQSFKWIVQDAPLTTAGVSVSTTEGVDTGLVEVATFGNGNANDGAGDFSATINWGDGDSSDTGTIEAVTGGYAVQGDHLYVTPGTYSVDVFISGNDGSLNKVSTTATVAAATLTTGAVDQDAVHEQGANFELGTISGANPYWDLSDVTVSVSWGDEGDDPDVTSGTLTENAPGLVDVWGEHTFMANGVYDVSWTVTTPSSHTATQSTTISVGDALYGEPAQVSWGSFAVDGGSTSPGDYTVDIEWGDYLDSAGSLTYSDGDMLVTGDHTYESPSTQSVASATILHPDDSVAAIIYYTPKVYDAPLTAFGANVTATAGVEDEGVDDEGVQLATFTDPNPDDNAFDFTPTVTDAGGSPTVANVSIATLGNGVFGVDADLTYATGGTYPIRIKIAQGTNTVVAVESVVAVQGASYTWPSPLVLDDIAFGGGLVVGDGEEFAHVVQWEDPLHNGTATDGWRDPVAFVKNGDLSVNTANFVPAQPTTGNYDIQGVFSGVGANGVRVVLGLPTSYNIPLAHGYYTYSGQVQLPNQVNSFENARIYWYAKPAGTAYASWRLAGTSIDNIYVSFSAPEATPATTVNLGGALFETPLSYGCRTMATTPPGIFDGIWFSNFASNAEPQVKRNDLTPLHYYQNWNTPNVTIAALLFDGDGQCSTFVQLLNNAIASQGLSGTLKTQSIRVAPESPMLVNATGTRLPQGLLVNNWSMPPGPPVESADPLTLSFPYRDTFAAGALNGTYNARFARWQYMFSGPVQYTQGRGQNSTNPAAVFSQHFILQVSVPFSATANGAPTNYQTWYFDPSYGTSYQTAMQFQQSALAGFFVVASPTSIEIRKPSATRLQIAFTPTTDV